MPRLSQCIFGAIVVVLTLLSGIASTLAREPDPKQIFMNVLVAEVNLTKLRLMGIDFEALPSAMARQQKETGLPVDHAGFLKLLVQNNLATCRSEPWLTTISGRTVNFQVGSDEENGTKLELTPKILDSGEIQLDASVELRERAPGKAASRFAVTAATDLTPGESHCLARVSTRRPNKKNEVQDYCTVVIVFADTKPPEHIEAGTTTPVVQQAVAPASGTRTR